jgi:vacuolar-type H+-ATPase subunit I/STV1
MIPLPHRLALLALLAAASVSAQPAPAPTPAPLSAEALATCAQRVLRMRTESGPLLQRNAALSQRRDAIEARRAALAQQAELTSRDDLEAGLARRRAQQQLNAEALALNREMQTLREAVADISRVRADYDRDCAQRPYRRRELEALPLPQQDAMRAGLAGVQVPELPDNLAPLPGVDTPP